MTMPKTGYEHETIGTEQLHRFGVGEASLYAGAFVMVVLVQAAGIFALTNWRQERELPGAPPPAIMIELADISMAPQVEDIAADDGELALSQDPAQAAEPALAEEQPEETPKPVPEPPVEDVAEPVEEPLPRQTEEQQEIVEAPEPVLESEVTETPVPDVTDVETAEIYVPSPAALPPSIVAQRREFAEKQELQRQEQRRIAQQQQAASAQTAPRSVEAEQSIQASAPEQTNTTRRVPNISPERWQSQVIAHLNRVKRYPAGSRSRREEGVPHLQFTIDPTGNVQSARIVRSSGFPELDQAALDMVYRASPVPTPPAAISKPQITLTVPVNFNLK